MLVQGRPTVREPEPPAGPLAWLAAGVPLTLLLDLADPVGPDSRRIYAAEAPYRTAAGRTRLEQRRP